MCNNYIPGKQNDGAIARLSPTCDEDIHGGQQNEYPKYVVSIFNLH